MNKTIFAAVVALMLVSKITCANAQQFATAEQARALLDRPVSALKTDEDKALTEFNDPIPKADIAGRCLDVRNIPKAVIPR